MYFFIEFLPWQLENRVSMDWGMVVTTLANLDCLQLLTSYSYDPHYRMTEKNIILLSLMGVCVYYRYAVFLWQKIAERFVSHLTIEYLKFEERGKNQPKNPQNIEKKKSHRNVMLCRLTLALKYYRLLKIRLLRREKDTHSSVWHPECYH